MTLTIAARMIAAGRIAARELLSATSPIAAGAPDLTQLIRKMELFGEAREPFRVNPASARGLTDGEMDQELVARARGGDHNAFAALVAARLGKLNAVARLILRDDSLAEDAVQDALVDAWRDLPALRDPERFDAWLRRLLVHSCYSLTRRRSRHRIREVSLPDDGPAVDDREGTFAASDELERGLRKLPIEQRSLLVLVYYLDLPLHEAAEALNVPLGTAKSRHHRALAALRAAVEAARREIPLAREGVA